MKKEYNIKRFDIRKMPSDSTVVLIGKRRTGKSFLMKDILYHKRNSIPAGIVISKTERLSPFFQHFIPGMYIHNEYDSKILQNIFIRQEKASKENWSNPFCFLVMDDCLSDSKSWTKDKYIAEVFYNGRHHKIFFMLAMQEPMGITPGLRGNIDYIFITKNNNPNQREKIYKQYAGMFPSFKVFNEILDTCTKDHNVLVIDNVNADSNKLEDLIFFYKAEPHDFKMFTEQEWMINQKIYQEENNITKSSIRIKI
jgi:hypothetical protein